MYTEEDIASPSNRPDLEEFLSALNGFLSRPATPQDPSYLRFLEIFFRTVGSNKGHLLQRTEDGVLTSLLSFGIGNDFDAQFNAAHESATDQPSPLDQAFEKQEVIAIVDLNEDKEVPEWFMELMRKHHFSSMVAVPLLGRSKPVGILCAYYNDVCLFDRGTLDHLMMIGRMVGAATEKSLVAERAESYGAKEKVADQFLTTLTEKPFTKLQMFNAMTAMAKDALNLDGLICGPVRKTNERYAITVASAVGVPMEAISHRYALPAFLEKRLLAGDRRDRTAVSRAQWEELAPLLDGTAFKVISHPILWQDTIQGAVIGWRSHTAPNFDTSEERLLARLAGIAALALNVS